MQKELASEPHAERLKMNETERGREKEIWKDRERERDGERVVIKKKRARGLNI